MYACSTLYPRKFARNSMKKIAYIFLFFFFTACETEKLPTLPTALSSDVVSESFQVKFIFSENAQLKAKMSVGHVQEKVEGTKEQPLNVHYFYKGVKVEFYNQFGELQTTLTSKEGKLDKASGLADLRGNVVASGKDGATLNTEQLFWDEKKDKFFTEGYVKMQTANRVLEGDGFESNTARTRYRIFKARGQVTVDNLE